MIKVKMKINHLAHAFGGVLFVAVQTNNLFRVKKRAGQKLKAPLTTFLGFGPQTTTCRKKNGFFGYGETLYLKVKIDGLPIPKGSLVKGPYKPSTFELL